MKKTASYLIFSFILIVSMSSGAPGATMADYTSTPPFLSSSIPPNVIIALDISGSMKAVAYRDTGAGNWKTGMHDDFNPAIPYFGYFDKDKKYTYDATNGFFKEDATGDWDGNFMNWLCMRRIDVARKVMIGGKVRDRSGESIGGGTWYVLLGQHEPYDYTFQKQYSNSDQYTPFTDNQIFLMSEGQIVLQTGQRVITTIVNQAAAERVEVGQVTMDWQVGDDWVEVPFSQDYTDPVVVAKSLSYNGSQPCVVRVKNVGDGSIGDYGGFRIRLQEWAYLDENHTTEDIMYVVADAGHHLIPFVAGPGQIVVDAQKFSSNACGTSSFVSKTFTSAFSSTPVLFTGVSTFSGSAPVTTRNQAVDTSGFQVTMQEEENADQSHASEEIHCIAFSQGAGELATTNEMIEIGNTGSIVTNNWYTINFGTAFSGTPLVAMDMQTTTGADPASLRFGHEIRTTSAIDVQVDEEQSSDSETGHSAENVGYLAVGIGGGNAYNIQVGVQEEPTGIIQTLSSGMRIGLMVYNYDHTKNPTTIYTGNQVHGGTFYPCYPDVSLPVDQRTNYDICLPTHCKAPLENIVEVIETHPLIWGTTPIAESLYEIYGYCAQIDHTASRGHPHYYDNGSTNNSYEVSTAWDPYYYSELGGTVYCARTFVLHFNDGAPYEDWDDPAGDHPSGIGDYDSDGNSGPQEQLDDIALYIRKNDIRDLTGHQEIISYYVYAALGEGEINNASTRKMREAAANGGFVDDDDDHQPDPAHPSNFVTYYQTHLDGSSCTTNEWDSDGDCNPDTFYNADNGYELVDQLMAAFQSILRRTASATAASVVAGEESGEGAVYQAVFYPTYQDDDGTEINWIGKLHGLFIDTYGNMREDTNDNSILELTQDSIIEFFFDDTEGRTRARRDTDTDGNGEADGSPTTIELTDINYLWKAGKSLAERDPDTRAIYTWVDNDGDGAVDAGEWIEFKDTGTNKTILRPYLAQSTDTEAQTLIDYIRGEDQTGYRSRTIDVDGADRVWKLGDIIYSTPTVIGKPKENYDLIYGDTSYRTFKAQYHNRRNVVYVGANDGMLHALNAGFYDENNSEFGVGSTAPSYLSSIPALGDELWAYIPCNLLPHLRWLADPDYSHVYYVDLKPKVIDAQIFAADATHPGGWGTVLVCGMRFGGGEISLTDDFGSGAETRTFRSAYFALDITDPEALPSPLWEFTDAHLGFTTSYPAIVCIDSSTWAIAFGSGPTAYDGTSTQSAGTYVVNLGTGAQIGSSLTTGGINTFMGDPISVDTDISDSQCSGATCTYSPDIAYIGNSEGKLYRITDITSSSPGTASLFLDLGSTKPIISAPSASQDDDRRLWLYFGTGRFFDDTDKVSTDTQALIGVKEPITDYSDPTSLSYAEVDVTNLLDVTDYTVFERGYIDTDGTLSDYETTFVELVDNIKQTTDDTDTPKHYDGWIVDITGGERCITKPTVLGGIVTFSTFEPDDDICSFEGESFLYCLYYKTGTAYYESIIGYDDDTITVGSDILKEISKRLSLGHGIAAAPSLHVGKGQEARAFIQSSTGEILAIDEENLPGAYKSRPLHWIQPVD